MKKGDISPDEFLTPETARGLRMSLISTMDMCGYLIGKKFKFEYLLTGKVNQDNLEVFKNYIDVFKTCLLPSKRSFVLIQEIRRILQKQFAV